MNDNVLHNVKSNCAAPPPQQQQQPQPHLYRHHLPAQLPPLSRHPSSSKKQPPATLYDAAPMTPTSPSLSSDSRSPTTPLSACSSAGSAGGGPGGTQFEMPLISSEQQMQQHQQKNALPPLSTKDTCAFSPLCLPPIGQTVCHAGCHKPQPRLSEAAVREDGDSSSQSMLQASGRKCHGCGHKYTGDVDLLHHMCHMMPMGLGGGEGGVLAGVDGRGQGSSPLLDLLNQPSVKERDVMERESLRALQHQTQQEPKQPPGKKRHKKEGVLADPPIRQTLEDQQLQPEHHYQRVQQPQLHQQEQPNHHLHQQQPVQQEGRNQPPQQQLQNQQLQQKQRTPASPDLPPPILPYPPFYQTQATPSASSSSYAGSPSPRSHASSPATTTAPTTTGHRAFDPQSQQQHAQSQYLGFVQGNDVQHLPQQLGPNYAFPPIPPHLYQPPGSYQTPPGLQHDLRSYGFVPTLPYHQQHGIVQSLLPSHLPPIHPSGAALFTHPQEYQMNPQGQQNLHEQPPYTTATLESCATSPTLPPTTSAPPGSTLEQFSQLSAPFLRGAAPTPPPPCCDICTTFFGNMESLSLHRLGFHGTNDLGQGVNAKTFQKMLDEEQERRAKINREQKRREDILEEHQRLQDAQNQRVFNSMQQRRQKRFEDAMQREQIELHGNHVVGSSGAYDQQQTEQQVQTRQDVAIEQSSTEALVNSALEAAEKKRNTRKRRKKWCANTPNSYLDMPVEKRCKCDKCMARLMDNGAEQAAVHIQAPTSTKTKKQMVAAGEKKRDSQESLSPATVQRLRAMEWEVRQGYWCVKCKTRYTTQLELIEHMASKEHTDYDNLPLPPTPPSV
jgi:hypothetical protein